MKIYVLVQNHSHYLEFFPKLESMSLDKLYSKSLGATGLKMTL